MNLSLSAFALEQLMLPAGIIHDFIHSISLGTK